MIGAAAKLHSRPPITAKWQRTKSTGTGCGKASCPKERNGLIAKGHAKRRAYFRIKDKISCPLPYIRKDGNRKIIPRGTGPLRSPRKTTAGHPRRTWTNFPIMNCHLASISRLRAEYTQTKFIRLARSGPTFENHPSYSPQSWK